MPDKSSYRPGEPTWVDLATPDVAASAAFYGALFGWVAEEGRPEFGGYANFLLDGKKVAGVVPLMSEGQPPVWSCYVSVDDATAAADRVTAAGGTTLAAPMEVGDLGQMAFFLDPTGAAFGVWQPGVHTGAETVHSPAALGWVELATRDQAAALPFYRAVFGWEPEVGDGYTEFKLGEPSVAGCMDMPEMVPAEVPSYWMPYFGSADPAADAERAAALGATVLVPTMEFPGGTFSVVQDPHGSAFGLLLMRH